MNPGNTHIRLQQDSEFKTRFFFSFFESISCHSLPDIDYALDPKFEPRCQCPPILPDNYCSEEALKDWSDDFLYEIKACGQVLQRHICHKVCHKYGNEGKCRFLFPHEIVDKSYFDKETNSVFLMCHDATINFFNPYILVFCRHNHDIKCILSGKAAKAAMFYITDYITKMDIKTHEMLSLMSKAVARTPIKKENEAQENAKKLLHKCLSQFSCQQQIHGQQAVCYLRGKDDTMMSHNTVPMLSSLLLSHIRTIYNKKKASQFFENEDTSNSNTENEPSEPGSLKLELDKNGKLVENNQVLDYFYRDEKLSNLNFYNFARCVRMEKCHSINNSRIGTHPHYIINPPHRLSQTHELVQYINPNLNIFAPNIAVPRVIGSSIP